MKDKTKYWFLWPEREVCWE